VTLILALLRINRADGSARSTVAAYLAPVRGMEGGAGYAHGG
jgi:hypothetical protein